MTDRSRYALAALLAVGALATSVADAAGPGRLPGVPAFKTCGAAGPFWPTETLAVVGSTGWLACKEEGRVVKLDLKRRKAVKSVRLGAPVIAVTHGYGSVWALSGGGTLVRIVPATGKVSRRINLSASRPYNLWIGAGSVWAVADGTGEVLRVSPSTNRVVARIEVGDGPADMVFAGSSAWVINHRDRGLVRIDTATNAPTRLATLGEENTAPERMALLAGSIWVTGRGVDLVRVDPNTGVTRSIIEIGASGIDVIATGGALWVPARSAAVDTTGFPTMQALRRVTPAGVVRTVATARGRLDVHGLAGAPGAVWLADNTNGVLYRLPAR